MCSFFRIFVMIFSCLDTKLRNKTTIMKFIIRAIPNTITLLNLLSGCIAIVFALRGWTEFAVYCIFAAAVFDFCDGLSARLLKAYSDLGKQLDSLSDLVSFGVAPAMLLHVKLQSLLGNKFTGSFDNGLAWELLAFVPFIIALFSALRLAKFNIDTRQTVSFVGLPVPANALLIASLISLSVYGNCFVAFLDNWIAVIILSVVMSFLLVCNLPMFALKFVNLTWKANKTRFIFLLISLAIAVFSFIFGENIMFVVALIIAFYILFSFLLFLFRRAV